MIAQLYCASIIHRPGFFFWQQYGYDMAIIWLWYGNNMVMTWQHEFSYIPTKYKHYPTGLNSLSLSILFLSVYAKKYVKKYAKNMSRNMSKNVKEYVDKYVKIIRSNIHAFSSLSVYGTIPIYFSLYLKRCLCN